MRKFFGILNLFLCFELIVGPMAPNFSFLSSKAFASDCGPGLYMDSVLNRCLTSAQSANIMNATSSCAADDVECYKRNAQDYFQKEVNAGKAPERKDGKINKYVSSVANAGAIAGPLMLLASGMTKAKSKCAATSFWLMVGGSAALLTGEIWSNLKHKKRLKEIRKEWGTIVNPESANGDKDLEREASIEAQSKAFEKLAEAEDSMVATAKLKKTFHLIATGAYAAAGIVALVEVIASATGTGAAANICKSYQKNQIDKEGINENFQEIYEKPENIDDSLFQNSDSTVGAFGYNLKNSTDLVSFLMNQKEMNQTHSSPSLDEYYSLKEALNGNVLNDPEFFKSFKEISMVVLNNLNPLPSVMAESNAAKAYKEYEAKEPEWGMMALGGVVGAVAGSELAIAAKKAGKNLLMPGMRAIFSGVMAGMTTTMALHAGSQAKASEERAKLLRKMQAEFVSASGAINACKSVDRNDPSKPTCYCYTPENTRNPNRANSGVCNKLWTPISLKPGNYNALSANSLICVTNTQQADPTCACKKSKSCMKVGIPTLKGFNAGSMSMIGQAVGPLNGVMGGSVAPGSVNTDTLARNAARMNAMKDKLEKTPALKGYLNTKAKNEAALNNEIKKIGAGMSGSGLLGSSPSSALPSNPGEAALMLEKELKEPSVATSVGGRDQISAPSNNGKEMDFDFGLTAGQLADQENQIAEVMKEKLDYGSNDITTGSDTNIFELLSNRYQRSGMRRLFDEKGTLPSDKPAKSDISQ